MIEQINQNKALLQEVDILLKTVINSMNDSDNYLLSFDNKLTKEQQQEMISIFEENIKE